MTPVPPPPPIVRQVSRGGSKDWILVGQGKSAKVFCFGDGRVIKVFHAAVSEEMIRREMTAAHLAGARAVSTAAPLERVQVEGLPALVYPEVTGSSLSAVIRKTPLAASALLTRMAELLRSIHSQAAGDLRTVKSVLETDIAYGPAPLSLQRDVIAFLHALPEEGKLLHGDFHLDNIIVSNDKLVVIDWAKASVGDPAADVVRSEMLMRFGEGPADPVMALGRDWAARRLRTAYQQHGGLDDAQLARWRPVVALAWLRARPPVRNRAFHRYLNDALLRAGLPAFSAP